MRRRRPHVPAILALAALSGLSGASGLAAQQSGEVTYPASFDQPMPLSTTLGPLTRPVTTTSPEAQAFFDQGVQLLYAFTTQDAARSFREAQKRDPNCAMCYLGEAWAWGPYLNGSMAPGSAPRAYAAIQNAVRLRGGATPVERALIDAMAVRYEPTFDGAARARLDTLYSRALEQVWAQYPTDLEVGTMYAESLMLLNRQRSNYQLEDPAVQRFLGVLDAVLTLDLRYPGACHLYIHATEATARPDKAEACAEHLGASIPGASHINHMPSHTFNRIGRWGDAVRANIEAWHSDQRAAVGEGFAIYPAHNLHMLLYAAAFDGQGAISIQAAKDYAKLGNNATQYHVLTLVRFGRFDEVLEVHRAPGSGANRGFWDFSRGYAHLKLGAADSARVYLAKVEEAAAATQGTQAGLLGIVGAVLRGEMLLGEGRVNEAIAAFEAASSLEDGLPYAEPGQLPFSPRHWLGAALLEANRPADAERVYRENLVEHPRNGWSLFGLTQALTAQGKTAEAAETRAQLEESWARSDTWLWSSRF